MQPENLGAHQAKYLFVPYEVDRFFVSRRLFFAQTSRSFPISGGFGLFGGFLTPQTGAVKSGDRPISPNPMKTGSQKDRVQHLMQAVFDVVQLMRFKDVQPGCAIGRLLIRKSGCNAGKPCRFNILAAA